MKKHIISVLAILFTTISSAGFAFSDVGILDWQFQSVEYLAQKGVISGYADDTFRPDRNVSRAEALKIILAATDKEIKSDSVISFLDVSSTDWFHEYVRYAAENNIIKGDADTELFSPGREVNKAEFIKILLGSFDVDPTTFNLIEVEINDVSETDWFAPYFNFAVKYGVIKLDTDGNAQPNQSINRGQAVQIIFNLLESGRGLDPQLLLNIVEGGLIGSINALKKGDLFSASTNVSAAQGFSNILMNFLPENKVVQSAEKTVIAVKNLIGAYSAGQNGLIEDIESSSKKAWTAADESVQLNPSQEIIVNEIKKFAEALANKARAEEKISGETTAQ